LFLQPLPLLIPAPVSGRPRAARWHRNTRRGVPSIGTGRRAQMVWGRGLSGTLVLRRAQPSPLPPAGEIGTREARPGEGKRRVRSGICNFPSPRSMLRIESALSRERERGPRCAAVVTLDPHPEEGRSVYPGSGGAAVRDPYSVTMRD